MREKTIKVYFRVLFLYFLYGCFISVFTQCFAGSIVSSKHNLSVSGKGKITAATESEVCIFCHTPHNASSEAPLWNRYASGQSYTLYTSTTSKAAIGQPAGASKLCLSCHDGKLALGMVRSRKNEIIFTGGVSVLPDGRSKLGIDLSDDHPVSFNYDSLLASKNPELKNPANLTGSVKLDKNGQLQCTSCHDPHDDEYGDFLVMDAGNSGLCIECHEKNGWPNSLHNVSSKTWNGILPDPWPHTEWDSVSENGCENCHRPHSAGSKERLLNYASEEDNCLWCHNANAAEKNIADEFNKASTHPIGDNIDVHDPAESVKVTSRHVECVDCHNSHAVNEQDTPDLDGSLRLVKGVSASGAEIQEISYEYELCFRCHAETTASTVYVDRQYPQTNTLIEFDLANASYHPVEGIGTNTDVPSLISPYTTSSIIKCSSCHSNNTGPNNSGKGPNGPHGSMYSPLLERQLLLGDGQSESYETYALCYKCHSRDSIVENKSFPKHGSHLQTGASCSVCHDPHGVEGVNHLINFDRAIVSESSSGKISFEDEGLGRFSGRCYLKCHAVDHNPKEY